MRHLLAALRCAGNVRIGYDDTSWADMQTVELDTLTSDHLCGGTALAIEAWQGDADHDNQVACKRSFSLLRYLPQLKRLRLAGFTVSRSDAVSLAGSVTRLHLLQVCNAS